MRRSLVEKYVNIYLPELRNKKPRLGRHATRRHNRKKRGIIHLHMIKNWSISDLKIMASVLSEISSEYTLKDDLEIIDRNGKTVFDEAKSRNCLTQFEESIKEFKET